MEIKRTFDMLQHALETNPKDDAFSVKRNGKWEKFSTKTIKTRSDYFSSALIELGFKKGDKIVSVSNNRPEWNIADFGMEQIGVIHVPIYPTLDGKTYEHILSHSDAKMIIVSSSERHAFLNPIAEKLGSIKHVLTFDEVEGADSFNKLVQHGEEVYDQYTGKLQQMKADISEDDISSIIYTSGTTGVPKGVLLTHKNLVVNAISTGPIVPLDVKTAMSFLPINHVFERLATSIYIFRGISIYYAESIEALVDNIQEIKPDGFATVPRVLEKIYDKIYAKGQNLTGIKKGLFFSSLRSAQKYEDHKTQGLFLKAKLAFDNKMIFGKWRDALGGNIKIIVSGGAALQPRLTRVFGAAKIPVVEGYGLTETSPVISANRIGDARAGTVGKLLDVSEVKIASDGEILYKGPCLMKGYYKDKERTNEVIDEQGWFHTGDMGELSGDILTITGRKKELFKLSTGNYVAPQIVENIMKESSFIEQIMVVGENEKFCSALISPNFEYITNWGERHDLSFNSNLDLVKNETVINKLQSEIDELNFDIRGSMQVKKFVLVEEGWAPDTGELSPTLKLKRNFLNNKYQSTIESLYKL